MIRVATVQFNHQPGEKDANRERVHAFCDQAAQQGARIIAFPEMCITGYWHVRKLSRPAIDELAEDVPGGVTTQSLLQWAAQYKMIIGAGLIERGEDTQLYNTYVVAQPDGRVHRHRKLHCFISEHMASGTGYTVFDTGLGYKIGVLICYDNNIIENARMTALLGADILLAPHQTGGCNSHSPYGMKRIDPILWEQRHANPEAIESALRGPNGREWLMRWLPARAHDNGLFILFSNGVGRDDDEVRTGNAMIIDCYGRILNETWEAADAMIVADLDMDLLANCTGRRWMRGRRPDLYTLLAQPTGTEVDARAARFS